MPKATTLFLLVALIVAAAYLSHVFIARKKVTP